MVGGGAIKQTTSIISMLAIDNARRLLERRRSGEPSWEDALSAWCLDMRKFSQMLLRVGGWVCVCVFVCVRARACVCARVCMRVRDATTHSCFLTNGDAFDVWNQFLLRHARCAAWFTYRLPTAGRRSLTMDYYCYSCYYFNVWGSWQQFTSVGFGFQSPISEPSGSIWTENCNFTFA
jgi:hypothetical protein